MVSAEFPGELRNKLRMESQIENLCVLYLPGFAGNVRAYPPRRKSLGKILRTALNLSFPVKYYRFRNNTEYDKWVDSIGSAFFNIWNNSEETSIIVPPNDGHFCA